MLASSLATAAPARALPYIPARLEAPERGTGVDDQSGARVLAHPDAAYITNSGGRATAG